MPDFVDIALLEVERADGTVTTLNHVVDFSVTLTNNTQIVKTMNRSRKAVGYKRGVDEYSGELTVSRTIAPEINWRQIWRTKEILQVYYEEGEDGRRFHLRDFTVTEVSPESGEDGESDMKVSFMCLDEVELP